MTYKVKSISCPEQIDSCSLFQLKHLLWGTTSIPETYGRLGYVKSHGLYLHMTCKESDPLCTFTEANSDVYKDSAMEAFFQFFPHGIRSPLYLNFEYNANGALHAKYGPDRQHRRTFPKELHHSCHCKVLRSATQWDITLHIPLELLQYVYGDFSLLPGDHFSCNFYKISEHPGMEHYASYSNISVSTPCFHLPEYFADAQII